MLVLTRWCAMRFRDRRRRGSAPDCNRSTRATRRKWPKWDSRWGWRDPARTDPGTVPCSDRWPNRRTSAAPSAAGPSISVPLPNSSHVIINIHSFKSITIFKNQMEMIKIIWLQLFESLMNSNRILSWSLIWKKIIHHGLRTWNDLVASGDTARGANRVTILRLFLKYI